MSHLKWRLLALGILFFACWGTIVPFVYPWIDAQTWLIPPLAFLVTISMYSFLGFLFSFGLVGLDTDFTVQSAFMGFLGALGLLCLDGLEPPLTVNMNGSLNTSVLGWRMDLLTVWHYIWTGLGVPEQWIWGFVILGLILTWAFVVLLASRGLVREYVEELT